MSVREEIEQFTKTKQNDGQDEQEYLKILAENADGSIDDANWEKLSADAQSWINAAITAIDGGEVIPSIPDEIKNEVEEVMEESEVNIDEVSIGDEVVENELIEATPTAKYAEVNKTYMINVGDDDFPAICVRSTSKKVTFEDAYGERFILTPDASAVLAETQFPVVSEEEKKEKKEKKEKVPKEKKEKKEKVPKEPKPPKEKRITLMSRGRELVCGNFELSLDDFKAILIEEGFMFKEVTANIIWHETHAIIEELKKFDHIK